MLIFLAFGSLLGTTLLSFFSTLPQSGVVAVLFSAGLVSVFILYWLSDKLISKRIATGVLGFIVGFSWAYVQASSKLAWKLPQEDIHQTVEISGEIVSLRQGSAEFSSFDLQIHQYKTQGIKPNNPVKIRLYWFRPTLQVMPGDSIRCVVKLKPPWRLANPGSHDQEKQFFLAGIRAHGKIISVLKYQPSTAPSLMRWRQQLNDRLAMLMRNQPFLGVIQATTLGIYSNITPLQSQVFQATGTIHAIAISGLHVTLVSSLIGGGLTALVRRSMKLTTLMPAKSYGAIASMITGLIYCALAGFSVPTQRALIMLISGFLAVLRQQPILSWQSLALAWLGIGLVDPLAPLQIGFWLSFACVGVLIYGNSHTQSKKAWTQKILQQWIIFLGLIPLSMLFFQQIPLFSPLANLLVLPIMDMIVVPFSLLGLLFASLFSSMIDPFAKICFWIAHTAFSGIWLILEKIAILPHNLWVFGDLPTHYLWLAFASALLLLSPKGIPGRAVGWLGFLPIIFYQPHALQEGECRFTLLDVGQGLSAVIQTRNHVLLFDAGPQYTSFLNADFLNAGEKVIKPFFRNQGITLLDKVIISHSDLDHRGGLQGLQDWPIGEVFTSEPLSLALRLERPARQCHQGEFWEWDGVRFTFLHPGADLLNRHRKRNDLSCVLKITTLDDNLSILIPGDIEKESEKALLDYASEQLKSAILVVPHHGSLTSSSEEFVRAVAPQYALYAVGFGNHYGFPKPSVVQRYNSVGSLNLLTFETGAITFDLRPGMNMAAPTHWRDTARHYWHG